ncbi:MAG: VCBS repeat-containing protein, partial [Segetibacter sp.]
MGKALIAAVFILSLSACRDNKLFTEISSENSGIHFNNAITDNDTLNVLDVENIYNGGGVGIADFNNDGLQDVYFTGNMVSNRLYLNKVNFKFEDITEVAGVNGEGKWCRGVSTIDINNDGLMDIYVSASLSHNAEKRENLLYINKGIDEKGVPHFKNEAVGYNLNDTSHSTMGAFFDYDNDGDLDMYLLVNEIIKNQYPNTFRPILKNGEHPNNDKLFRNDWNDSLKHPVFTNVSKEAGITIEGYGHGVSITDINKDGWKDIYVTNDFLSNNILYINNLNGTFTNKVESYFKHTSENSMGQDVIDINNDGLADVIEVDMNPEDNYRKKMMMNPLSYQRYQNNNYYGYQYQYVRNVLQLNQGPRVRENDTIGPPVFSDISFFSGIAETDWSWTPSVADFDNDGFR